ncbi:uncharacterized protein [Drosophila virilis]|uniref:RING-type domain-containing protein n=1 Tax=Drosophila virilis TaxID=7244 RepID=B4LZH8_DROVI|nr:RING finger and CHY zinc finger domain-containing protein 1 [Drosophila virilis]EDW67117.2 uncharacterized protein Dvir_GJ23260 [Drosophila virilis]
MVYMQLIMSIGCVIAAAAAAIYFSMPAIAPSYQSNTGRRSNDSDDNNDCGRRSKKCSKPQRLPASKPGDKCIICLKEMTAQTMHIMNCGHALCQAPCFAQYREFNRYCLYCEKVVIRINVPGDDCCICCEPMSLETIQYLPCEHALHKICLESYKKENYKTCPLCSKKL